MTAFQILLNMDYDEIVSTTTPTQLAQHSLKLILLLSLPVFSFIYLKKNIDKMGEDQFSVSFGTLYTNIELGRDTAYKTTALFCLRRLLVAIGTIFV